MGEQGAQTEEEFLRVMEEIDSELRADQIPIHARPLKGWMKYGSRFKLELRLVPQGQPKEGCYSGDDLSIRIFQWFDRKYGDRLKMDFSPGSTVALIRGDLYKLKLPFVLGRVALTYSPSTYGKDLDPVVVGGDTVPVFNVLDAIEEGTPELFNSLTPDELKEIHRLFVFAHGVFQQLRAIPATGLVKEAVGDIEAAVFNLFTNPPQYGLSKWASLQATEKFIKSYITKRGGQYKNIHDLDKLATAAESLGLRAIPRPFLDKIQCSPGVRYGTPPVTLAEAVEAHHTSLDVCAAIAEAL